MLDDKPREITITLTEHMLRDLPAFRYEDKVFMTGQEWFDRFRKEYRALSPNAYAKDRYAKMAAEKASGL